MSANEMTAKIRELKELKAKAEELKTAADNAQLELAGLLNDSDSISRKIEEKNTELNGISAAISDNRVAMVTAKSAVDEILWIWQKWEPSLPILGKNKS